LIGPLPGGARSFCAHCAILEWTNWAPRVPRRCGFRSGGFRNDPVLRRCAFNRCSILDTAADSKTTDAARDPSSRQRGHREGADKEGTLAAMKALWRELADPKIKEHHGPVVKDHTAGRDREPERQAVV
jgi:hypothetical protein